MEPTAERAAAGAVKHIHRVRFSTELSSGEFICLFSFLFLIDDAF